MSTIYIILISTGISILLYLISIKFIIRYYNKSKKQPYIPVQNYINPPPYQPESKDELIQKIQDRLEEINVKIIWFNTYNWNLRWYLSNTDYIKKLQECEELSLEKLKLQQQIRELTKK